MPNEIHPDVELASVAAGVELHDRRTGFRILIESSNLDPQSVQSPQFALLMAELGCLVDPTLSTGDVHRLQGQARARAHAEEQDERIDTLLRFATQQVAYYRERHAIYRTKDTQGVDDLRCLPTMSRVELRRHFQDLLVDGEIVPKGLAQGVLELVTTSGTTDERLQAISDMRLARIPPEFEDIWGLSPFTRPPRTAVVTSPGCMGAGVCSPVGLSRRERMRRERVLFVEPPRHLFGIGAEYLAGMLRELEEFEPDFLLVNPVYAHWIAKRATELGFKLPKVSAVLSSYQYLSRIQRRALTALFDAPVFSIYAATELGGCHVGIECREGRMHVREDHCAVEFVTRRGPAAAGELGALLVTTLAGSIMPLIRYRIGDVGALITDDCNCPIKHHRCFELHGRHHEMVQARDCWWTTRQVDEVVSNIAGIDFYRLEQTAPGRVDVDLLTSSGGPFEKSALVQALWDSLGLEVGRVRFPGAIEPMPSLKFPIIRSHLEPLSLG
jgi:phenylacetate-CoA ligase